MPRVSVVMPVFNAAFFLESSIQSILDQTYRDFEFIIINDGSTDESFDIIKEYEKIDSRVKLISNINRGLVSTLNIASTMAKGDWILRMDADDISHSSRLEKQLIYANYHQLDLCGTWAKKFGISAGNICTPVSHNEILIDLMFRSTFVHPTMLIKREVFNYVKYSEEYKFVEDYKFWCDCASLGFKFGNVPEFLLYYRVHNNQVSIENRKVQKIVTNKISNTYFNDFIKEKKIINDESIYLKELFKNPKKICNIYFKLDESFKYYFHSNIVREYLKLINNSIFSIVSLVKFISITKYVDLRYFINLISLRLR